jgi:antitoxin (DNA-binding transcriptional repressor) of toxin-antitoxin stability system
MYAEVMKVTITEFRRNLFKLADKVVAGQTVEFVHRGVTVRLVMPEAPASKLDRLTPRQITNPEFTEREHRSAERKMRADMLAAMEEDWTEI